MGVFRAKNFFPNLDFLEEPSDQSADDVATSSGSVSALRNSVSGRPLLPQSNTIDETVDDMPMRSSRRLSVRLSAMQFANSKYSSAGVVSI